MGKLSVFNHLSVDGFFTDRNGDMSWAHPRVADPEFDEFIKGNVSGEGILLFGRVTYDLMVKYWPTPQALKNDPVLAGGMNRRAKIVFSRTMKEASWQNTRLVNADPAGEVARMKKEKGEDMVILGSGTLVAQLTQAGLVDEYQFLVNPLVLGAGRTLFEGVTGPVPLRLVKSRAFANGKIFLTYERRT